MTAISEAKARLKWCPFARVTDNGCATNRHAGEKTGKDGKPRILRGNALCIASECMAWKPSLDNDGIPTGCGSCGLAGRPS